MESTPTPAQELKSYAQKLIDLAEKVEGQAKNIGTEVFDQVKTQLESAVSMLEGEAKKDTTQAVDAAKSDVAAPDAPASGATSSDTTAAA